MVSTTLEPVKNDAKRPPLMMNPSPWDDDNTEPASSNRSQFEEVEEEMHVKWQMPGNQDLISAKKQLMQLLGSLLINFPGRITLVDHKHREWCYQEKEDEEKFQTDFKNVSVQLHPLKNKQQRTTRWVAVTKIRSTTHIKDWKNNDPFYTNVTEAKTYVFPHPFKLDEWDIVSIGFIKEVHAIHYPKELLHEQLHQLISDQNINAPTFQLIPQRITTTNKKASTKAFIVQCPKSTAKQLIHILTHGKFRDEHNQMFVPFKFKSTKPETFLKCIRQQNDIYYKTWIIKVEGISYDAMEVIKTDITNIKGVHHVVPSKRAKDIGEWKIMVDQTKCAYIHRMLSSKWTNIVAKIPTHLLKESPQTFSTPRISSKKLRDHQDSDSDTDSYGSLLTTGTDATNETTDDVSLNELPTSYQYPTYANAVMASTTSIDSTQISSPTTSNNNDWLREKQELEGQIQKQAAQIEKIQSDLQTKISRSQDLEEQLAQAIDLAHSRDARQEEMLEKFERLMQYHHNHAMDMEHALPSSPPRNQGLSDPPPSKKANTNSSPNRTTYALFKQPPTREQLGHKNINEKLPRNQRSTSSSSLQHMDTDDDLQQPPGAKSGQKLE